LLLVEKMRPKSLGAKMTPVSASNEQSGSKTFKLDVGAEVQATLVIRECAWCGASFSIAWSTASQEQHELMAVFSHTLIVSITNEAPASILHVRVDGDAS